MTDQECQGILEDKEAIGYLNLEVTQDEESEVECHDALDQQGEIQVGLGNRGMQLG